MKALIFGAGGQDGQYLAKACRTRGIDYIGISRSAGDWIQGDVAAFAFVKELIRAEKPDLVFHLAANSTTRHDCIFEHHRTIGEGALNILESVRLWAPDCKVFITGSGLQFLNREKPLMETDPFDDSSSYATVRNYSVHLARYFRRLGVRTYVGYLFHHESPLRKQNHVSQMIVQAVKRIADGSREKIELGDVAVRKEWTFVGDIVEGILTLVGQDRIHEAVIGSGLPYSIEDWLATCFGLIGRDWHDHVIIKEGFKAEYPLLVSDPGTMAGLGWHASVNLADLAGLMLNATPEQHNVPSTS